ncbi:MAG: 50S ribosomal protein L11 methyltransferase [Bacteroidetes bacterium]|nr:50S ribosomal protein L11 methyltransferase [Bacteroidota bacterium]
MEYIEVNINGLSGEDAEILTAGMSELGFESFLEETAGIFSAYIPIDFFDVRKVSDFLDEQAMNLGFSYKIGNIPEQNWNAVWESAYQPVKIGKCFIRAPFHEPDPAAGIDLVIEPKMSFGTAHHETTHLMIKALLQIRFEGSSVLDIGTGTGILGIIALKLGAKHVVAIDNDEWSFLNAKENAARNNVPGMIVIKGSAADIPSGKFGYILANINRNVLLHDIPVYHNSLENGGSLILSGFYEDDLDVIREMVTAMGMMQDRVETLNHWVAVTFKKC